MPPNTKPPRSSRATEGDEHQSLLPLNKSGNNGGDRHKETQAKTAPLSSLFQKPQTAPNNKSYQHYQPDQQLPDNPPSCCGVGCGHEQFAKCKSESITSTIIGSLTFLLYHVVYCLAQASTITRPHAGHTSVGVMAKMAAIGTLFAGPVFVWELGLDVPAIYPASDLFLSPFLAQVAADIDDSLYQHGLENNDRVFLATFGALIGFGFLVSGIFCIMAARIKLANLGSFLPYCVLCGFFSTIGILIWSLGFSVDTGMKVGQLINYQPSEEGEVWSAVLGRALLHHAPSFTIGVIMHIVGQKNSLYVIALILATLVGSYATLWFTGTSLEEAQELNWFFSSKDLQDPPFLSQPVSIMAPGIKHAKHSSNTTASQPCPRSGRQMCRECFRMTVGGTRGQHQRLEVSGSWCFEAMCIGLPFERGYPPCRHWLFCTSFGAPCMQRPSRRIYPTSHARHRIQRHQQSMPASTRAWGYPHVVEVIITSVDESPSRWERY